MRRASVMVLASLLASAGGCIARSSAIGVTASDFDLNPLVGEWRGDYNSGTTGRTGTIAFTLRAGEGAASGNVVMIPRADSLLTDEEREALSNTASPAKAVLKIHFVRKEGGSVSGTLDPYRDPDCGCAVTTTFQGVFRDSRTIEGTFTTVPSAPGGSVTGGKWKAIRIKKL
jgi:hypothetical protein